MYGGYSVVAQRTLQQPAYVCCFWWYFPNSHLSPLASSLSTHLIPRSLNGRPLSWSPDSKLLEKDLIGSSVGDGQLYENDDDCRDRADIRCATANDSITSHPRSIFQPLYEPGRRSLGWWAVDGGVIRVNNSQQDKTLRNKAHRIHSAATLIPPKP